MSLDPPDLTTLRHQSLAQLRGRWEEVVGPPPAIPLSREFLCAALSWEALMTLAASWLANPGGPVPVL